MNNEQNAHERNQNNYFDVLHRGIINTEKGEKMSKLQIYGS